MPYAPKKPCTKPGCPALVDRTQRMCPKHQLASSREYNAQRPETERFYHTGAWQRLRREVLQSSPTCAFCGAVANTVDHIIPIASRYDLRAEPGNLQSLCHGCHNRKTARESAHG